MTNDECPMPKGTTKSDLGRRSRRLLRSGWRRKKVLTLPSP